MRANTDRFGDDAEGEAGVPHEAADRPTRHRDRQLDPASIRRPTLKGAFLKGPVDWEWIVRAAALKKPALPIGLGLWREAGLQKDHFLKDGRRHSKPIRVASRIRKKLRMSTSQASRGLRALADVGLISIVKGGRGRCQVVTITNLQASTAAREGGDTARVHRETA
jgi:hypothetical protein